MFQMEGLKYEYVPGEVLRHQTSEHVRKLPNYAVTPRARFRLQPTTARYS